jgi:hypothetical protein
LFLPIKYLALKQELLPLRKVGAAVCPWAYEVMVNGQKAFTLYPMLWQMSPIKLNLDLSFH